MLLKVKRVIPRVYVIYYKGKTSSVWSDLKEMTGDFPDSL